MGFPKVSGRTFGGMKNHNSKRWPGVSLGYRMLSGLIAGGKLEEIERNE
jgi:hypothetical protein